MYSTYKPNTAHVYRLKCCLAYFAFDREVWVVRKYTRRITRLMRWQLHLIDNNDFKRKTGLL